MTLNEQLDNIAPRIPELHCFVVPTSFDPNDADLRAYPIPNDWTWRSCEMMLRHFKARAVMMRLPLFWQLEPALHAACRAAGAPIFINEPENTQVGAEAVRQANIDTVVSEAADAPAFSSYLAQKNSPRPHNWILVHRPKAEWMLPGALVEKDVRVAQEVHLFPGMVAFSQCEALADAKATGFHLCEDFFLENLGAHSYVTNAALLVPLERFEIAPVREKSACVCGKPILEPVR